MEHTLYSTDLGEWLTNMNNEAKGHWLRKDSKAFQHMDLSSEELAIPRKSWQFHERVGNFSEGLFTCSHASGAIVEWDWLCYSKTQGKVYCFYCKLFR